MDSDGNRWLSLQQEQTVVWELSRVSSRDRQPGVTLTSVLTTSKMELSSSTMQGDLHLYIFILFLAVCCRFSAVLGITTVFGTQFDPSLSCGKDRLTFDSRNVWYTEKFMMNSPITRCPGPVVRRWWVGV